MIITHISHFDSEMTFQNEEFTIIESPQRSQLKRIAFAHACEIVGTAHESIKLHDQRGNSVFIQRNFNKWMLIMPTSTWENE